MSTSTVVSTEISTAALPEAKTIPAAIGEAFAGGIYAGISRGVDGGPDQHLVLLPGEAEDVNWEPPAPLRPTPAASCPRAPSRHCCSPT